MRGFYHNLAATEPPMSIRVTVWNEFIHEKSKPEVAAIYPDGIHGAVANAIKEAYPHTFEVATATLDQPEQGLPDQRLNSTDVLFWWGHAGHDQVEDALVDRIQKRVLEGMGLVVLHSGHESKPFKRLMGTQCQLRWREDGQRERLWVVDSSHPTLNGLDEEFIELDQTEMYGEPFGIPSPDDLVLVSWFAGGEVFRSLCTWTRGRGKVVYFRPGHETYPIYHHSQIKLILANCATWAAPSGIPYVVECRNPEPFA